MEDDWPHMWQPKTGGFVNRSTSGRPGCRARDPTDDSCRHRPEAAAVAHRAVVADVALAEDVRADPDHERARLARQHHEARRQRHSDRGAVDQAEDLRWPTSSGQPMRPGLSGVEKHRPPVVACSSTRAAASVTSRSTAAEPTASSVAPRRGSPAIQAEARRSSWARSCRRSPRSRRPSAGGRRRGRRSALPARPEDELPVPGRDHGRRSDTIAGSRAARLRSAPARRRRGRRTAGRTRPGSAPRARRTSSASSRRSQVCTATATRASRPRSGGQQVVHQADGVRGVAGETVGADFVGIRLRNRRAADDDAAWSRSPASRARRCSPAYSSSWSSAGRTWRPPGRRSARPRRIARARRRTQVDDLEA